MPIKLLMPALSPTMTEGKLARWVKKEGDQIEAGDVVAEIETDKATMEFEAVDEGKLGRILVPEGTDGVKVNQPIGLILEEGEDASALDSVDVSAPKEAAAAPAPAASAATPTPAQPAAPSPSSAPSPAPSPAGGRVFASPLARRLARDNGLDLGQIQGSGPHGRVVKRDVEAALAAGTGKAPAAEAAPAPAAAPSVAPAVQAAEVTIPHTPVPNSSMRKVVARRLTEAKQQIPHFYLTIDCRIDDLLALRKQLNDKAPTEGKGAYKLSVNDLILKAAALALVEVPEANASWTDEAILQYDQVDMSVAVAIEGGLITPIIKQAETKGLATISSEMKTLAAKARDGKLMPEEYQGGTFTISNLGMFGIREFAAIINPPQGCILAIGKGEKRPVVIDDAVAVATMMTCTLSVDHRAVDGAVGARFLDAFKRRIEDPITMIL